MKLIVEERGKQITYEIDGSEPAVIGRELANLIPIRESSASRKHCQVLLSDGGAKLEDLGSKNGTLLNGKKIAGSAALSVGDCIEVEGVKIWFGERRARASSDGVLEPPRANNSSARGCADAQKAPAEPAPGAIKPLPAPDSSPSLEPPPELDELDDAKDVGPSGDAAPAAVPAGRFKLVAVEGEHAGKTFPIERVPFKLGRTKKNVIQIHDAGVSGEHCEIVSRGDGCALVDLGSTNGTRVNGAKVKRAVLVAGARIAVGNTVLVFHDTESVAAPEGRIPQSPPGSGPKVPPVAKAKAAPAAAAKPAAPVAAPPKSAAGASGRTAAPPPAPKPAAAEPVVAEDDASDDSAGDALDSAADLLGVSSSSVAIDEEAPSSRGALAVAAIGVAVLCAAALFAFTAVTSSREAPADADPAPRGNRVANWSFEETVPPGGAPAKWQVEGGRLGTERGGAVGGASAGVLEPARGGLAEAVSLSDASPGGREVHLRAHVRGGPAAIGVDWDSSGQTGLDLISTTDVVQAGDWTELQATFRPPPGADRARVRLYAAGDAAFDRVVLAEREASTGRPPGVRVEAGGLVARIDDRGLFALERDEWPIFDRGGLALLGEGPLAPLARQEAAMAVAAPAKEGKKRKVDPAARVPRVSGTIARPDGAGRAAFVEEVDPDGKGGLSIVFRLAEAVPTAAPAIAIYIEHAGRAGKVEVTRLSGAPEARDAAKLDEVAVRELALGSGSESVALRFDAPLRVTGEGRGRGLVLTLAAAPGQREIGFVFARGSTREQDSARADFELAEAEKRAGRLEEARKRFARIAREHVNDRTASERARQAENALIQRAESALAEGAAIEGDIKALGAGNLLESAEARCRFVLEAYPETRWATRAEELLRKVAQNRAELVVANRVERAKELLALGRRHLEDRRFRIARLYLRAVMERYPDLAEIAADARRDAEIAERNVNKEPG